MDEQLYRELADLFFIEAMHCADIDEEARLADIAEALERESGKRGASSRKELRR